MLHVRDDNWNNSTCPNSASKEVVVVCLSVLHVSACLPSRPPACLPTPWEAFGRVFVFHEEKKKKKTAHKTSCEIKSNNNMSKEHD